MIELLQRMDPAESLTDSVDAKFARECRENLGVVLAPSRNNLTQLRELGIHPFTRESVERYKAAMEKGWFSPKFAGMAVFTLGATVCLAISALTGHWEAMAGLVLAAGAGLAIFMFVDALRDATKWWKLELSSYASTNQVPEFVLQTALDVNKKLSGMFLVDTLQVIHQSADPFLVFQDLDGQQFYLEVWNEPTFKQERVA